MCNIDNLLENNKKWAAEINRTNPEFFPILSQQQKPEYLWIGCSDSRVPANEIVGMLPGEIFVHRNVANLVIHTDLNCLSVVQFAVEVLKVKHIIVCGHYGCGGVAAAVDGKDHGLIDNWIMSIKELYYKNKSEIDGINSKEERINRLCEMNVIQQVKNLCHTTIIQGAWKSGQELFVHGCVYSIKDGILHDLDVRMDSADQLSAFR